MPNGQSGLELGSMRCYRPPESLRLVDTYSLHSPWPAHNCGISSSCNKSTECEYKNVSRLSPGQTDNSWMSTFKCADTNGVRNPKTSGGVSSRSSLVLLPPQTSSLRPGQSSPVSSLPRLSSTAGTSDCPDFCPCAKRRAPSQYLHINKRVNANNV